MADRGLIKMFKKGLAIWGNFLKKSNFGADVTNPAKSAVVQVWKQQRLQLNRNRLHQFAWNTFASEVRRTAAERFISTPGYTTARSFGTNSRLALFGFVGFGLSYIPTIDPLDSSNKQKYSETFNEIQHLFKPTQPEPRRNEEFSPSSLKFGSLVDVGCTAAVYKAEKCLAAHAAESECTNSITSGLSAVTPKKAGPIDNGNDALEQGDQNETTCAVKVMFNYELESNAQVIINGMKKELLPLREELVTTGWIFKRQEIRPCLPRHPNIVDVWGSFVGDMQVLEQCLVQYPMALPKHIYPPGLGRNKTLFIVMKKYQTNGQKYWQQRRSSPRQSLLMLVQLLEGVLHLNRHGISHRDLKSNNILVDSLPNGETRLVITDFGSSLVKSDLRLAYNSEYVDRGGNAALMAPEISSAQPGPWVYLDYSKADIWACGAIAYEIFGSRNPFSCTDGDGLNSARYTSDELPQLTGDLLLGVGPFVYALLQRNPAHRPSALMAANTAQLLYWMPSTWITDPHSPPSRTELISWLLLLAVKALLMKSPVEGSLLRMFLSRMNSIETLEKSIRYVRKMAMV